MKRRANGEGTIYETIKRNKRASFLAEECSTCKACLDRSKCDNRTGYIKCDKCKQCTDCLKYCDRFYCYKTSATQITLNGERKSTGSAKNKKEAKLKKEEKTEELQKKDKIKHGDYTLSKTMRYIEENKLNSNITEENSYIRNIATITAIEKHPIAFKKMRVLTEDDIKSVFTYFVDIEASQSQIEKVYDILKSACKSCEIEELFDEIKRNTFISLKDKKDVIAFSSDEEQQLLDYINMHQSTLVCNSKSAIDSLTVKNIIKFALATSMRIGEICALNRDTDIDTIGKKVIVSKTLTKNKENKIIVGKHTKTGKKARKYGKKDIRFIPFDILFDENDFENFLNEQLEISKNNINNTEHLLFCRKDGGYISHSSFNCIFKRICRQAGIKLDLKDGCNTHMTKHTCVTRLIENGMNIYAISALVGTSVEVLQETYAHILDSFVEKEIQKAKVKRADDNMLLNPNSSASNNDNYSGKIIAFKK